MKIGLIVLGVLTFIIILVMTLNLKTPSTIGVVEGKLAALPDTPNAVSSQTNDPTKQVRPFPFKGDLVQTKAKILAIVNEMNGTTVITVTNDYIHIVCVTEVMKYRDDVEFYFDLENEVVHFRSASRIGYSDKGLNKQRYELIWNHYMSQ